MTDVNLILAFGAGVLGFVSPCIVPLIPGYLSFVSGVSLAEMDLAARRAKVGQVLSATALFVLGFSIIFTALGASASALGSFIVDNRVALGRVGGSVVLLLGLSVLGVVKVPGMYRERRLQMQRRPGGLLGAVPVGMAFGFAWIRRHGRAIETFSGAFLVVMGGAMIFDLVFRLNTWILRVFPFRPAL